MNVHYISITHDSDEMHICAVSTSNCRGWFLSSNLNPRRYGLALGVRVYELRQELNVLLGPKNIRGMKVNAILVVILVVLTPEVGSGKTPAIRRSKQTFPLNSQFARKGYSRPLSNIDLNGGWNEANTEVLTTAANVLRTAARHNQTATFAKA